jgi:hypothetical protein
VRGQQDNQQATLPFRPTIASFLQQPTDLAVLASILAASHLAVATHGQEEIEIQSPRSGPGLGEGQARTGEWKRQKLASTATLFLLSPNP